jgi:hypothetical protein
MHTLKNTSHPFLSCPHAHLEKYQPQLLSLSCLPVSAFSRSRVSPALLLSSLLLRCGRASRHSGFGVASTRVGHNTEARVALDVAAQRHRWPSYGWISVADAALVAPQRIWLPLLVVRALPPCRVTQPQLPAHSLQAAVGLLPLVNSTGRRASILPSSKEMLHYIESAY